ncbi:MAG TPA: hypothetical protein VN611_04345 [Patescibacteria group bacterium]|nr:hypothetical protein [Patescibacteria group bacterium]
MRKSIEKNEGVLMDAKSTGLKIMEQFREQSELYREFTARVEDLLSVLLEENGIRIHSIASRVKDNQSLEKKVDKNSGKYTELKDITDIAGVRIITYFDDDVDQVAEVIEREFDVDWSNSIDKRQLIDPDRFGYVSLHYIAALNRFRLALSEYKKYRDCKVEFQVRSILQHAWAEIEHDLGYKRRQAIPREIRRSFSRLAGLLEIADQEFKQIRDSLMSYENQVGDQIALDPDAVYIDGVSLAAYIEQSPIIREINQALSQWLGGIPVLNNPFVDDKAQALHYLGLDTIGQLDSRLSASKQKVIRFAQNWLSGEYEDIMDTIGIFYFCYYCAGENGSEEKAQEFLASCEIGNPDERLDLARRILTVYRGLESEN